MLLWAWPAPCRGEKKLNQGAGDRAEHLYFLPNQEGLRCVRMADTEPPPPASPSAALAHSSRPSLPHSSPVSYPGQNQHLVCPLTDCSSVWKIFSCFI